MATPAPQSPMQMMVAQAVEQLGMLANIFNAAPETPKSKRVQAALMELQASMKDWAE